MIDSLVKEWFDLLYYTQSGVFNQKDFKYKIDVFTSKYKRLSDIDQGEFHHQIHRSLV